jgi:hypothetical protein
VPAKGGERGEMERERERWRWKWGDWGEVRELVGLARILFFI